MSDHEEFIREFIEESEENLNRLDEDFVALEEDPQNAERLQNIFRTIHTIKGTSGFFSFSKLGALAHAGESLLSRLRDGDLLLNQAIADSLLEMVDGIRDLLSNIEQTGEEGMGDYTSVARKLSELMAKEQEQVPNDSEPTIPESKISQPTDDQVGETSSEKVEVEAKVEQKAEPTEDAVSHAPVKKPISESTIRVDVRLLDQLMDLAGELVLTRNRLNQFSHQLDNRSLTVSTQQLSQITSALQERIMKTRMQPIGSILNRFQRVVRDLAVQCGKHVELRLDGTDTELDRSLLEAIKDPLTHLVRNAIDHGIEASEQRIEAGKSHAGTLRIHAYHDSGQVHIDVSDDGGGMDVERIREKVVKRGLMTFDSASQMSDFQILQMIFVPGFSTAEKVSDISGRGVGMDVVKNNIEKTGGTLDIRSQLGRGTTIKITIPLTLAIVPALMVSTANHLYALPQASLLEVVSVDYGDSDLQWIQDVTVYRLRDEVLPLVSLRDVLQLPKAEDSQTQHIVVLQVEGVKFGLVVDEVRNVEEIVVKAIGNTVKSIGVYAAATIMGDGSVALILDVSGIARRGRILEEGVSQSDEILIEETPEVEKDTSQRLLVCQIGSDHEVAIRLNDVDRLEELSSEHIESSAGQWVAKYRGEIMPLIDLPTLVGDGNNTSPPDDGSVQIAIIKPNDRYVGFVVVSILDIVDGSRTLASVDEKTDKTDLILGVAVAGDRILDVMDTDAVIRAANVATFETL